MPAPIALGSRRAPPVNVRRGGFTPDSGPTAGRPAHPIPCTDADMGLNLIAILIRFESDGLDREAVSPKFKKAAAN